MTKTTTIIKSIGAFALGAPVVLNATGTADKIFFNSDDQNKIVITVAEPNYQNPNQAASFNNPLEGGDGDDTKDSTYMIKDFNNFLSDLYGFNESKSTFVKPFDMYDLRSSHDLKSGLDGILNVLSNNKTDKFDLNKIDPFIYSFQFTETDSSMLVDVAGDINNKFGQLEITDRRDIAKIKSDLSTYESSMNLEFVTKQIMRETRTSSVSQVLEQYDLSSINPEQIVQTKDGSIAIEFKPGDLGGPSYFWGAAKMLGGMIQDESGQTILPTDCDYCTLDENQQKWLEQTVQKLLTLNPELKDKHEDRFTNYLLKDGNEKKLQNALSVLKDDPDYCAELNLIPDDLDLSLENLRDAQVRETLRPLVETVTDYWVLGGETITLKIASTKEFQELVKKNPMNSSPGTQTEITELYTEGSFDIEALVNHVGVSLHGVRTDSKEYTDDKFAELENKIDRLSNTVYSQKRENKKQLEKNSFFKAMIAANGSYKHEIHNTVTNLTNMTLGNDRSSGWRGFGASVNLGLGKTSHGVGSIANVYFNGSDYALVLGGEIFDLKGEKVGQVSKTSSRKLIEAGANFNIPFNIKDLSGEVSFGGFGGKETADTDMSYNSTFPQSHEGGSFTDVYAAIALGAYDAFNMGLVAGFKSVKDEREPSQVQNVGGFYQFNKQFQWSGDLVGQFNVGENSRINFDLGYHRTTGNRVVNSGLEESLHQDLFNAGLMFSTGDKLGTNPRNAFGPGAFGAPGSDFSAYILGTMIQGSENGYNIQAGLSGQPGFLKKLGLEIFTKLSIGNTAENAIIKNGTLDINKGDREIQVGLRYTTK